MKKLNMFLSMAMCGLIMFSCSEKPEITPNEKLAEGDELFLLSHQDKHHGMDMPKGADMITFDKMMKGDIVSEVHGENGMGPVKVWGEKSMHSGKNAAMIFDSSNPTGGDWDLGTPHMDFGGPGKGEGGKKGSKYENKMSMGNVLIISEDLNQSEPNDANTKAHFTFDFSHMKHVTLYSLYMIDVDKDESVKFEFYDHEGKMMKHEEHKMPNTGDNGVHKMMFGHEGMKGVAMMKIHLNGSGAVDDIVFKEEKADENKMSCTSSDGYWKNHGKHSMNYDTTWMMAGEKGEDTEFFKSGKTWMEMMMMSSKDNAYAIMAREYMATKLNMWRGAEANEEVKHAVKEAEKMLNKHSMEEVRKMSHSDQVKMDFMKYMRVFEKFNDGKMGHDTCNDMNKDMSKDDNKNNDKKNG